MGHKILALLAEIEVELYKLETPAPEPTKKMVSPKKEKPGFACVLCGQEHDRMFLWPVWKDNIFRDHSGCSECHKRQELPTSMAQAIQEIATLREENRKLWRKCKRTTSPIPDLGQVGPREASRRRGESGSE
ncbi:hypothetical protein UFOVP124_6 [uncultured Caudovirales phage]|uniref:Uncharacterized protein n=1 Tax=uncultured Caudovirales phage TaxID=2100421 RepID=A0A6J5L7X6_9CAUD|nr:hypothetical protein UFOVP124_6 [uncultured Caudovirales phage]